MATVGEIKSFLEGKPDDMEVGFKVNVDSIDFEPIQVKEVKTSVTMHLVDGKAEESLEGENATDSATHE